MFDVVIMSAIDFVGIKILCEILVDKRYRNFWLFLASDFDDNDFFCFLNVEVLLIVTGYINL